MLHLGHTQRVIALKSTYEEKKMKSKISLILLAGLLLVSIALTACSGSTKFPTGKFLKANSMNSGIELKDDGSFSVFAGDTTLITGTYSVDGNVFTETSNTGGCSTNVDFNYTFDGKNLTFTYVGNPEDDASCTGRYADFNNVSYTLQK